MQTGDRAGVQIPSSAPYKNYHRFDIVIKPFLVEIISIIFETTRYIELFLENLLFNGNHELKNRYLHIRWNEKVDIERIKMEIAKEKVDIEKVKISKTIRKNIEILYQALKDFEYFGRKEIIDVLKMSPSGASKLISKLLDTKVIIQVFKHGKGKYCFNINRVNYE